MAGNQNQKPSGGPGMGPGPMRGPMGRLGGEKPKETKATLKRLIKYFVNEKKILFLLFIAVFVMVICTVYAPKLQSNAIDNLMKIALNL